MNFLDELEIEPTHLPEVDFPFNQHFVPEWIFHRGFTKQILKHWESGVTVENGLAIPIKDLANTPVGWVVRREQGFPKYLYPQNFKKSRVLFGGNLVQPSELLCVVEGPLDAMWLNQLGYNAVAILGMSISKKQVELVQELPVGEVVLCLDNDEAGQIGKEKALTYLGHSVKLTYIDLPSTYKDVQEVRDKQVLDTIIRDRNYW
jgi:DNA primase